MHFLYRVEVNMNVIENMMEAMLNRLVIRKYSVL